MTVAPIFYFLPALRNHQVLGPDDGMLFNVPLRVAAANMVRSGRLPLWNPYIFSGMPLLGSAQGGLLFPLNWFYLVFSPAVATDLMVISAYMLAASGAYFFARRTGASIAGAMTTSLIWQAGGFLIGQISHINIVPRREGETLDLLFAPLSQAFEANCRVGIFLCVRFKDRAADGDVIHGSGNRFERLRSMSCE